MAVPTFTSITPTAGPSMGGNMAEIIGTNFRLPDPPPATGIAPKPGPTVEILFGTIAADPARIFVVSATRMFVKVPPFPMYTAAGPIIGPQLQDVTITNLDNAGVPIAGETVTAANAYAFDRVDISGENPSDLQRLIEELIKLLASETVPNVVLEQDSDFDDDTTNPQPAHATLPAISIIGPELTENRFYTDNSNQNVVSLATGETLSQKSFHTVDLVFDIIGYADSTMEFLNLLNLCEEWKDRNQKIKMLRDPLDLSKGFISYDFVFTPGGQFKTEKQLGTALNSNLRVFKGEVVINGFQFEGLPGVIRDKGVGVGADVDAAGVTLQPTEQTGDNLLTADNQPLRSPPDPQGNC